MTKAERALLKVLAKAEMRRVNARWLNVEVGSALEDSVLMEKYALEEAIIDAGLSDDED